MNLYWPVQVYLEIYKWKRIFSYFFRRLLFRKELFSATACHILQSTKLLSLDSDNHAFWWTAFLVQSNSRLKNPYYVIDHIAWQLTVPHTDEYFQNSRLFTYIVLSKNTLPAVPWDYMRHFPTLGSKRSYWPCNINREHVLNRHDASYSRGLGFKTWLADGLS